MYPNGGWERWSKTEEIQRTFLYAITYCDETVTWKICYAVWKFNSAELENLCNTNTNAREEDLFRNRRSVSTIVLDFEADERCFVCVRVEWFKENISKYLGDVDDCYIKKGGEMVVYLSFMDCSEMSMAVTG